MPKAIEHGIPEGNVGRLYGTFPFLKNITPDKIRSTPATDVHIADIILRKLQINGIDVSDFGFNFRTQVIKTLKQAIYDGFVVASHPSQDAHNPKDKQLEIYIHLNLDEIDSTFTGIAKLRVICRLSVTHGTLTIRTISKDFKIEQK